MIGKRGAVCWKSREQSTDRLSSVFLDVCVILADTG